MQSIRFLRNAGPVPPCARDCKGRSAECHGKCEKYLAYNAERQKWLDEQYAKRLGTPGISEQSRDWMFRKEKLKRDHIYV